MDENKIKKALKLIVCLLIFMCITIPADASADKIVRKAINKSDISKTALISVSFKDINTGRTVVDYNSNLPTPVASVQKVITTIPALNYLGEDYKFATKIYKGQDKSMYVKLGADPYLTSDKLQELVKYFKTQNEQPVEAVYIDDLILDRIEWGEGWQWDNTLNKYIKKFGTYNIDNNLIDILVRPTKEGASAEIKTDVFYPIIIKNNVMTGSKNNLKLTSIGYLSPDNIEVSGTVNTNSKITIPINDLRKYFILRFKEALKSENLSYYKKFTRLKTPDNAQLVSVLSHPITQAYYDILQNSDNTVSETVFKIAGGKYSKQQGSFANSQKMFYDYYNSKNINTDGVKITDASGVSHNNRLNANFIANVLLKNYSEKVPIKKYMAYPGKGTLENRMLYLQGKLIAKTGTLQNISAIAGYLKAENGRTYSFCIIINDAKSSEYDKKSFEEYLIRKAYEAL